METQIKFVNKIRSSSCKEKVCYLIVEMDNEQDSLLPIANVGRMMKQILPPTAKISKECKQVMQECATEFISFVTSEASDKCQKENRKTVNGDDICWALSALGFDNYAEAIGRYLHKYRQAEREKAAANQRKGDNSAQEKHEASSTKRQEEQTEIHTPALQRRVSEKPEISPANQS